MRFPNLYSLAILIALAGGATASHAIDVYWELENQTTFESGTTITAENGDLVVARVYLETFEGVAAYSFSLAWDESLDDELDLVSFQSTPPPPLTQLLPPGVQESGPQVAGQISQLSGNTLAGSFVGSAQLAEFVFRVERVSPDGVDMRLFLSPGLDGFYDPLLQPLTVVLPDATVDGQAECDDAIDNDGDGLTDFSGGDPGCTGFFDGSERQFGVICDDGEDNDGDGKTDFPADPECASPSDSTEDVVEAHEVPALRPFGLLVLAVGLGLAGSVAQRRGHRVG